MSAEQVQSPTLNYLSAFFGFLSALALFELQELWKGWVQVSNLRRALKAELDRAEFVLSVDVLKTSAQARDNSPAVKEFKWIMENYPDFDLTEAQPLREWTRMTSGALADAVRNTKLPGARTTTELKFPVLETALSSTASMGLSSGEMIALTAFNWQIQLLNSQHGLIMQFMPMTFTVEDPNNHKTVMDNLKGCQEDYRVRLTYALEALREALEGLRRQSFWEYIKTRFGCG